MNYPKRGTKSDDGKLYTASNGGVYNVHNAGKKASDYELIKGAYVPTDEVLAACDMARKAIEQCRSNARTGCNGALTCVYHENRTCELRLYLEKHKQPDAWEVTP